MEPDLLPYIESLDHDPESERILENIYIVIKRRIEDPIYDNEICDTVFQMYQRLCRERGLSESYTWWTRSFSMYKWIRQSIANRSIEPELSEAERTSNLYLVDSILFYIKLMSLHIRALSRRNAVNNLEETD